MAATGKLSVGNNTLAKLILERLERKAKELEGSSDFRSTRRGMVRSKDYYETLKVIQEELGEEATPRQKATAKKIFALSQQQDKLHQQRHALERELEKAGLVTDIGSVWNKSGTHAKPVFRGLKGTQTAAHRRVAEVREARKAALQAMQDKVLVGLAAGAPEGKWVAEILKQLEEV